ncbi:MAG: prefoldin subunit [Candidatus Aenigmatarchaeota archaeon]
MTDSRIEEEYQSLQEQYRAIVFQKETIKLQLLEIENAIKELEQIQENFAYKIVGNVMIKKNKDDMLKELKENKEDLELRLSNFEKMEKLVEEKIKERENIIKKGGKDEL